MAIDVSAFKAYDLRGRVPDELDENIARSVGRAYAAFLQPREVVVGHDIRLTGPEITSALIEGLTMSGVNVNHIGTCGTEEIYFACDHYGFDGGIAVTASHNPKDYNGMKFVRDRSKPISADTGLNDIRDLVAANRFAARSATGKIKYLDHRGAYLDRLLAYLDPDALAPLKIVSNPGNGGAGPVVEGLKSRLPMEFVDVHAEPDGNFPNGVPNPLLPENRTVTIEAVTSSDADLGIAWDGDFDRCFFFDEKGRFIEGYYILGLLAKAFLDKVPGSTIVYDPRLIWNTIDIVETHGGKAIRSKAGHAFVKERMRAVGALYGGETCGHHYFRDFAYCDSGMLPWLLVVDLMSRSGKKLSELVDERIERFPVSGEINRRIEDPAAVLSQVEAGYATIARHVEYTDGLGMSFGNWRFNLRSSNTEPVVRLNVEARGDAALVEEKTAELLALLGGEVP